MAMALKFFLEMSEFRLLTIRANFNFQAKKEFFTKKYINVSIVVFQ